MIITAGREEVMVETLDPFKGDVVTIEVHEKEMPRDRRKTIKVEVIYVRRDGKVEVHTVDLRELLREPLRGNREGHKHAG